MDRKVKAKPRSAPRAARPVTTRAGRKGDAPSPVSAKRQVTLPVEVLRKAGIAAGDLVWITSDGPGSIRIEVKARSAWDDAIGAFTGIWDDFDLRAERDAWER